MKKLIFKAVNTLAQVTIWAGFELLRLSARLYSNDIDVRFKPSRVGAVITIRRADNDKRRNSEKA